MRNILLVLATLAAGILMGVGAYGITRMLRMEPAHVATPPAALPTSTLVVSLAPPTVSSSTAAIPSPATSTPSSAASMASSSPKNTKVAASVPVFPSPPVQTPTSTGAMPLPPASPPALPPATPTSAAFVPPPKNFPPGALVGIVCNIVEEYTASDPQFESLKQEGYSRGTGVIIDKRGYILTNRHVGGTYVQRATTTVGYTEVLITITYRNTGCWVGDIPKDTTLPTREQIDSINPTIRIPLLAYKAEPLYEPSGIGWSNPEKEAGDFTILKITGLSDDAKIFGVNALPQDFPYAELLPTKDVLKPGMPVLSYGAPADVTVGMNELFSTIYILGATGQFSKAETGDLAFLGTPLTLRLAMEVSGGRSGSPVLWNGYLIGLIRAHKKGDKTQTVAVASDAVLKYLRETAGWEPAK